MRLTKGPWTAEVVDLTNTRAGARHPNDPPRRECDPVGDGAQLLVRFGSAVAGYVRTPAELARWFDPEGAIIS